MLQALEINILAHRDFVDEKFVLTSRDYIALTGGGGIPVPVVAVSKFLSLKKN